MTRLTLPSPAKLNLFLHITGRRSDGYHELQTVFQLLDYGDSLCFSPNTSGQITLGGDDLGLGDDNLIARAARCLQHGTRGVHIDICKRIPAGGGLGGGSSNAATTLVALNQLWACGLSPSQLAELGLSLGADVPVFVAGHSAWAEGVGECLTPLALPEHWYLVIHPGCHVSTGEIFSDRQLTRNSPAITIAAFFQGESRNDCQKVVASHYPEVDNALKWLENFGNSRLTGTGACVFASFTTEAEANVVLQQVPTAWQAFVARGLDQSPMLEALT